MLANGLGIFINQNALKAPGWPEPSDPSFNQGRTGVFEVFQNKRIDLALAHGWEGEFQITSGDVDTLFTKAHRKLA
ncbi:Uncharacterised protein [Vibrio cholerae]|nr:Uncharacterised protein [Vibrio cholerae]CSB87649.1 Uncharacterised protein [Vibrio cholerae]